MEVGDFFFFVPTCFSKLIVALIPVATGIAFSLGQLSDDLPIFLSVERYTNRTNRGKKKERKKGKESECLTDCEQSQGNICTSFRIVRREREYLGEGEKK